MFLPLNSNLTKYITEESEQSAVRVRECISTFYIKLSLAVLVVIEKNSRVCKGFHLSHIDNLKTLTQMNLSEFIPSLLDSLQTGFQIRQM